VNSTTDFADGFSPMLVKELRQGMRSWLFVISFLLVQTAMILVAIIGLYASARQWETGPITGFFWTILVVPLLIIMPMSGLGAVANERKGNTLELIFLTRLTARRILVGKWVALVAQTVLLVCAILPYAVLRYFLGGINLGAELTIIALLLVGSAVLSGLAVGFSPQSSRLTRPLIIIGVFIGLQFFSGFLFRFRFGGGPLGSGSSMNWLTYLSLGWLGLLFLSLMLEFGASKIAPAAENHATPRRLIGLIAIGSVALFGSRDLLTSPLWVCSLILLAPICLGALCEPPSFLPSVYHPFGRFGGWGRLAGRFLYPGWPSGVLFTLAAVAAMLAVGLYYSRAIEMKWILWAGVAGAGALYFPAALIQVFMPRAPRPFILYLGIQAVLGLLVAFSALMATFNGVDFRFALAMIPTCGLLFLGSNILLDENILRALSGTGLITAASFGFLLFKMREPWRKIRALEKAATALPTASTIDGAERATAK
jgi:hypothetical protein